jgi:uncharacterized damage-inducible protein DinB
MWNARAVSVLRRREYDEREKGKGRRETAAVTIEDLHTLVDFHYWARDRMLDALEPLTQEQFTRDMGNSFRSIRDTTAHMYSAEWAWHSRWLGVSPAGPLSFDMFPDLATLRGTWSELEAKVRAYVGGLDDAGANRVIEYKLFSGAAGATPFWQMLQHLVNHGSYHRGQVTTMLRQLGAAPAKSVDLITFYRERGK